VIYILTHRDSGGYTVEETSNLFPIMDTPSKKLSSAVDNGVVREHPFSGQPLSCNAGRLLDLDSYSWLPKKCLRSDYPSSSSKYENDLCAYEYAALDMDWIQRNRDKRTIQNVESAMDWWKEIDAYNFITHQYKKPTYAYDGGTQHCPCESGDGGSGHFCNDEDQNPCQETSTNGLWCAGALCGKLSTTKGICGRRSPTSNAIQYCATGIDCHNCGIFGDSCNCASTTVYYSATCTDDNYFGKSEYLHLCPARDGDAVRANQRSERSDEWDARGRVLAGYYTGVQSLIDSCAERFKRCSGETACDLSGCENDYISWACTDPRTDYQNGIITHNYAETLDRPTSQVFCSNNQGIRRQVVVVKAEIGRGFDTKDASSGINSAEMCGSDSTRSWCSFSITDVARRAIPQIDTARKTLRVETICSCPEGYEILADANDECVPCAPGEYRDASMSSCELVLAGYYSSTDIPRQREPCGAGTFSNFDGATHCDDCPAGYYNLELSSTICLQCPPGTISPLPGLGGLCNPCDPGQEPNVEQTACISCSLGSAKAGNGGVCTKCGVGTFADGLSNRTRIICDDCPLGSFQASRGRGYCDLAPIGFYVDTKGQSIPNACPEGALTVLPGSEEISDCQTLIPTPCPDSSVWQSPSNNDTESCENLMRLLSMSMSEVGNGFCQPCLNVPECSWDGGDCCPETCKKPSIAFNATGDGEESIDLFAYSCSPRQMQCLAPRNLTLLDCSYDEEPSRAHSMNRRHVRWIRRVLVTVFAIPT
jgi:hypothetical protein